MEGASLEELLSHILNPDNVLRKRAEKELEHRSSAVPGFCASLADYCTQVVSQNVQLRLAEVAFAVLKRGIAQSVDSQEVQYIVSLFLTHLGNVAVVHGVSVTTLLQWTSVVATGVRRLAVLRGSTAATQDDAAALAAACFEAAANMATSQLLNAFALFAQADDAALRVVCSHLYLLQTIFEGSVTNVLHEWCGEVVASCAAPLLEMLCASAAGAMATAASQATAPSFSPAELQMRCALQSLVAETLVLLYEWQFAASRRGKFRADLKRAFIESFATLQACVLMPCAQWVSSMAPASSAANIWEQRRALARVSPLLAAALSTQRLVVKVLQYGGWYKRCATPELLEGLLSSLEADVGCNTLALAMDDEDASAGGWAGAGPCGTLADGWVALGTTRSAEYPEEGAALVVRSHVTQRWTLFRDIAFLPSLRRTLTNIVDDQLGRRYFQLLLSYAALSPSEAAAQMESPNTFLRNEGDREDGVRWTARDTVAQLYTESINAIGPVVLHAAMEDLSKRLSPESGSSESSSTSGLLPLQQTLQLEAPLFFMEAALRHSAKQVRACSAAIPAHLAQHIWTCYVTGPFTTHPVTATRAVMLVAAMTEFACTAPGRRAAGPPAAAPAASSFDAVLATAVAESAAMLSTFTGRTAAAGAPASPCPLLVAVVLCQFLQRTLPYWPPHVLAQHFCALQEAFLLLLSPQAGLYEEALYGVVEQLTDLLHAARRCDAGAAAAAVPLVAEGLPATVMACWRRHVSDPSFADVMLQLLRLVVRDRSGTSASPALSRLLEELAWVNKVLCGYADSMAEVCAVPYFLRLLRSLFAHATDDVANAAAALMLDSLCQLLLCTEESAILVASSSCLAALLRRCPSANTVQVHVVAATVEAALSGTAMTSASSSSEANGELIAHAPRTAYPFSAVIVAIVLRTLQDDRGEASLMEMGETLTTIMHHSTSFTEADLIRVIHATVHRLGGVRTDTVREQLLAPLATLLRLHPAALLHTLVQCGLMAETMAQWLPRLEHFTSVGVTYASCAGLLGLLQLLSQPTGASLTAEEGQRVAQQTVVCRWRLPESVAGNGGRGAKRGVGKKGASGRKALDAILFGGAVVETSLPLYAAILIAVGRGVLTLLAAPLPALRRAARSGSAEDVGAGNAGGGDAGSSSDDDDREGEGGRRLFQESSDDGEQEEWEEEVEDFDDDDDDEDGAAAPLTRPLRGEDENAQDEANVTRAAAERRQLLAAMGADLLPWMQQHGAEVMPYFTAEETQLLTSFFASAAGGTGSA